MKGKGGGGVGSSIVLLTLAVVTRALFMPSAHSFFEQKREAQGCSYAQGEAGKPHVKSQTGSAESLSDRPGICVSSSGFNSTGISLKQGFLYCIDLYS